MGLTSIFMGLSKFEPFAEGRAPGTGKGVYASSLPCFEFHINKGVRAACALEGGLFQSSGNVIIADFRLVRELALKLNSSLELTKREGKAVKAGQLNAMGLIDEILHYLVLLYKRQIQPDVFEKAAQTLDAPLSGGLAALLESFCALFPPRAVYSGASDVAGYLAGGEGGASHKAMALEELLLLAMANLNPAFRPFLFLFDDASLKESTRYSQAIEELQRFFASLPVFGPDGQNLWDALRAPALACPDDLAGQLRWMKEHWGLLLEPFLSRLVTGLDVIAEEEKPQWGGAPGPTEVYDFGYLQNEYEQFSHDEVWMPRTVLMAKSALVWLFQLSGKYGREIARLDQIPDEELDELARQGFTGLWLIGLWERSAASRTIKQWKGNPEAAASAYSLYDYDIAGELGGWGALCELRERCGRRGLRLGSDMVPNHTGIDSRWIVEHPDRFLQLDYPPYPQYQFTSGNLSTRDDVVVQIEDHYYNNSDCAVVFHHYDRRTDRHRYIYHGNDGTSMPWNDTAQIDFLNPEAREAVIRTIVGVCQQFPIVRFDAAMTLAKRHIQRLWYPEPGHGGDIASRAEHAVSTEEFNRRIPNEFWREVVDRCAAEAPHTLLLAEAFWMMEGYFVRTLGMHRVYNSAFMNMLKKEENAKYRATVKNTLEFDGEILKRFVNFMNNPDEDTAVAQFGKGDKYFGVCTLMVTMPGLPMFGHGQIEGFEEKYGMEYRRAYRDEAPDEALVERHNREIFPLMKRRMIFSGSADFCLFDFYQAEGCVNENVFAYANRCDKDCALVLYNNFWERASGWIKEGAVAIPQKDGACRQDCLASALLLHNDGARFTLMRDQRRNRWIIRSSKELYERGLFSILQGYEAQVYIDVHEVEDADGTSWARLHTHLNGAFMKAPEEALQDMVLDEVYAPFWALFSKERLDDIHTVLSSKSGANGDALKKDLLDFVTASQRFLKEGDYEAFKPSKKCKAASAAEAVDAFCKNVERFAAAFAAAKSGRGAFAKDASAYLGCGTELALFVYAYAVFQLLGAVVGQGATGADAASLAEHWHLDRKFREAAEANGVDGGKAYRVVEIAKAALRRVNLANVSSASESFKAVWQKSGAQVTASSIILENTECDDFKRILGVNVWEGTTWFNKESFGEALFFGAVFALEYAKPADLLSIVEKFHKAEPISGYRLDFLIDELNLLDGAKKRAPAAPKAAKPAAGSAEKKAPARPAPEKKPATKKEPKK
ncbi:MAG: alpha-amylase [Spirochaetaceae bacterium]|nr:alpha-amylase [Spirochaetaceae bacterium]